MSTHWPVKLDQILDTGIIITVPAIALHCALVSKLGFEVMGVRGVHLEIQYTVSHFELAQMFWGYSVLGHALFWFHISLLKRKNRRMAGFRLG